MRRPAQSVLVEFFRREPMKFIVALDLLQAPAVGESVRFANVEEFQGDFIVTEVRWCCGLMDDQGRVISPGDTGIAFQTATVRVRRKGASG